MESNEESMMNSAAENMDVDDRKEDDLLQSVSMDDVGGEGSVSSSILNSDDEDDGVNVTIQEIRNQMQFAVCFAIVLSLALAAAQRFGSPLPAFGLSSLTGDFGGPTAFGGQDFSSGSLTAATTAGRDPRQNRGPVVFPPPPTDGPMESSGVVVGASGYGFVPPNAPQNTFHSIYRNLRYF